MSGSNILLIVTGSIAAYKACEVASHLIQLGHRVRVVATASSLKFVGESTWEGLTGEKVLVDLFAPGAALEHIQLTRWAVAVVVCPATANTLNRFAAGLADDLPGAIFLARDPAKPFLVAPAMNPAMWAHPATVAAVTRLREWGVGFVEIGAGRTACGEIGLGRLPEPASIVAAVTRVLQPPVRRLRVLVTSGATVEPIDAVRFISNLSTGQTGARIAAKFHESGHEVVLLRGIAASKVEVVPSETFSSTADLADRLQKRLSQERFDAVIHAAAVSDFTVTDLEVDGARAAAGSGKLPSGSKVSVHLGPTPKLVETLRKLSCNAAIKVIAFKLTVGADERSRAAAVTDLFLRGQADLVVHNDLAQREAGGAFPATLYLPAGRKLADKVERGEIGAALEHFLLS